MVQVNVQVDESVRDRWEKYIEENEEVNTKSALIRLAVAEYISDSGSSDDLEEVIGDLRNENQELKSEVERIHNKVRVIDDEVRRDKDNVQDISSDILAEISLIKSRQKHPTELISSGDKGDISEYGDVLYTIDEIRDRTGYEKSVCRKALDLLVENIDEVRKLRYEGTDYYYRSEFDDMEVAGRL
jgi:hypothetical protein